MWESRVYIAVCHTDYMWHVSTTQLSDWSSKPPDRLILDGTVSSQKIA